MTLEDLKTHITRILENNPDTRGSDDFLYYFVCDDIARANGQSLTNISFAEALLGRRFYGFPGFESVRRTRQKIQAERYDLKPDTATKKRRKEAQDEFYRFAKKSEISRKENIF